MFAQFLRFRPLKCMVQTPSKIMMFEEVADPNLFYFWEAVGGQNQPLSCSHVEYTQTERDEYILFATIAYGSRYVHEKMVAGALPSSPAATLYFGQGRLRSQNPPFFF